MHGPTSYSNAFRVAFVWVGATILTAFLHEFGHWAVGTILGNEMSMSLNTVHPVGAYIAPWHAPVVTAAGPVVTLIQGGLAYVALRRGSGEWVYPFLLAPFVFRGMAMAMNVVNPNDEGRLSEMLGLNLYVLPAAVCGVLLWFVIDASRAKGYGWKRNVLGALLLAHLLGALILLDQTFSIRLL